jgi:hypothetical protein
MNGEGAKLSIEEGITHGRAIRIRIQKPMAVDPSMNPTFMGQCEDRLIFAGDRGVSSACLRMQGIYSAKKEPSSIEMMDERHLNDQPRLLPEISLLGVGFLP